MPKCSRLSQEDGTKSRKGGGETELQAGGGGCDQIPGRDLEEVAGQEKPDWGGDRLGK